MKQLSQKLMNGRMGVIEVPAPVISKGLVLVQNAFSVISAGTEGSRVKAARRNLLGKAMERPQQAMQLLALLKQSGPVHTYRTAMKKLESYSPLGYSCAGVVIGVGDGVSGVSIGDKVACAGATANHSEIVTVPEKLCVVLHADADLKYAAYNSFGAIALQGVRQADLRLGETCVVIGLGLLGQLTCLLLKAAGNRAIGIDIDPEMVKLASRHAIDLSCARTDVGIATRIEEFTKGIGSDAAIITAATEDTDPVNFAGQILKRKGRVVVVGNVPTGFEREPFFYQKELELKMSCSYGPGRYDPVYEEKGIDYPPEYVRWTERRNMELFQELIHSNVIQLAHLTTHVFKLEEAPKAYDLITERKEPYLGIVIKYDQVQNERTKITVNRQRTPTERNEVGIAFIGAGSYAMGHLLPNIPKEKWVVRKAVMTASGLGGRTVAEKFGFEYCASSEEDIFGNEAVNTVFVATRHNTHAQYVVKALRSGRSVFVEKPLCLTETELESISELATEENSSGVVFVGFNRRFSPLIQFIQQTMGAGPMSMTYRINAGTIPGDSWIQDKQVGGGRIIGEVCHFIDLLTFLNGSLPRALQAFSMAAPHEHEDTCNINILFENGSIGAISYFANGSNKLPKEYLEIYKGGATAILRDFREAEIVGLPRASRKRLLFQDKGQATMMKEFLNAVKNGNGSPIAFREICAVTKATFRVLESLRCASVTLV